MFTLKSTLIVMLVLMGLLGALSFTSVVTVRQAWYEHDKSEGLLPSYAIAGGVKVKP